MSGAISDATPGSCRLDWLEPGALGLFLELPQPSCDAFLLDVLVPLFDAWRRERRVRGWTFGPLWPSGFSLLVRPEPGLDGGALSEEARRSLAGPLAAAGGRFVGPPPTLADRAFALQRFAGDGGIRIFRLFNRRICPLSVELLRRLREDDSPLRLYAVGAGAFFFLRDALSIAPEELLPGLEQWISGFGAKKDPGLVRACREQAEREFRANAALVGLFERLEQLGWSGALDAPLAAIFSRHAPSLRRVGRALALHAPVPEGAPTRQWRLFHCHTHPFYMALGFSGTRELFLMMLLRRFFESPRRSGSGAGGTPR